MNYELALKLKEAGWTQINLEVKPGGCPHWGTKEHPAGDTSCGCFVSYPTLEELIEACGDSFDSLRINRHFKEHKKWVAYSHDIPALAIVSINARGMHGHDGDTPTEAAANLWLALQEKK